MYAERKNVCIFANESPSDEILPRPSQPKKLAIFLKVMSKQKCLLSDEIIFKKSGYKLVIPDKRKLQGKDTNLSKTYGKISFFGVSILEKANSFLPKSFKEAPR